jgi:hypothetical protein
MTREHAKELLPIITAFAEGKNVQTLSFENEWITTGDMTFQGPKDDYRIAPKPRKVWINEYPNECFSTWPRRMAADFNRGIDRIACHEIEIPPLP